MEDIFNFKGIIKNNDTFYYKNKGGYKLYSGDEHIFIRGTNGDPLDRINATYSVDKMKIVFRLNPNITSVFSKTFQMTYRNVNDMIGTLCTNLYRYGYDYTVKDGGSNNSIEIKKYGDQITLILNSTDIVGGYKNRCTDIDLIRKLFEMAIKECMYKGLEVKNITDDELNTLIMENGLLKI